MDLTNRFYTTLKALGMDGIEHPVFYKSQIGIRFDIGDSSDIEVHSKKHTVNPLYIDHCLNRTTRIMNSLSAQPDILAIQLHYVDQQRLKEEIKDILSVAELPYPDEIAKKENEPTKFAVLLWDLSKVDFSKETLLKEIVVSDLGGEHLLASSVFWIWSSDRIMFLLYDDRGADLVAAEKSAIKDVYLAFNKWILEHDREKIESTFCS